MDLGHFETYEFNNSRAFNLSTGYGYQGRSYRTHWHSYGEIILVGEGDDNIYRVNQNTYSLQKGDLVLIWPMEIHEIVDADRQESIVVQFSNGYADTLFDFQRIMHYFHDLHVVKEKAHPELAGKIKEHILEMKDIYLSEGRNRETRCCMHLMQVMLLLDEYRKELTADFALENQKGIPRNTIMKIVEVSDYIKDHLTEEDLSQATMAERAGISKEYFSRIFKELTGSNYSKWLNMIRVEKAISLFPQKGMSLTEIALLSGFQSIPSFNRVFRELKGLAPSEYRSMNVS